MILRYLLLDSREITIDIDSIVDIVEGNQEGAMKGYNPNKCYNVLMSFCSELKCFFAGFKRSDNTYASNGTAEMIKPAIRSQERM